MKKKIEIVFLHLKNKHIDCLLEKGKHALFFFHCLYKIQKIRDK